MITRQTRNCTRGRFAAKANQVCTRIRSSSTECPDASTTRFRWFCADRKRNASTQWPRVNPSFGSRGSRKTSSFGHGITGSAASSSRGRRLTVRHTKQPDGGPMIKSLRPIFDVQEDTVRGFACELYPLRGGVHVKNFLPPCCREWLSDGTCVETRVGMRWSPSLPRTVRERPIQQTAHATPMRHALDS